MKSIALAVMAISLISAPASADVVSQTTTSAGTVSTTVQTPTGTTTITTAAPAPSVVTQTTEGVKVQLDSDNSVYQLFPSGARVAAPNGHHTLVTGETINVRNGKRVP